MRLHEPCKFCYWTKMGVQLPTASSRQILEAEAGEKGRRFLFKCCSIWENGRLLSQIPSPPGNPEENSATLSQTKIKGNVQSSFSHSKYHQVLPKYHFGNHRWLLSGHPGSSAFSQPLPGFRLLPGTHLWALRCHWPCSFQGRKVLQMHQPVCYRGG